MAKSGGGDYFKRSSLFWIVFVTLGVGHFSWVVFAPGTFPFQYLGPYGTFCRYLVDNHSGLLYKGWWAALAIHAVEAFVSLKVCSNKGINSMTTRCLWFFQTFLFGFASLGLLIKYKPERRKKN
ncbi:transmembrane protein 254 [Takifugu flavidus]|uniref:Transmembrane protein 254 n=1 Tax=Takifugu flavidus TaxID=433684 RepID=A0A5C6PF83_9TELE|nr:transmembrane protein 254 [Takifugu flavidus]TWW78015.1 Transmembrane protein 254 [Takifugu flavidus]